jgi:hypothetical protein
LPVLRERTQLAYLIPPGWTLWNVIIFLQPKAHSGVQGCQAIREVLQFEVTGDPLFLQISGASTPHLNVAILPAE